MTDRVSILSETHEVAAAALYNERHGMWTWAEADPDDLERQRCLREAAAILRCVKPEAINE